MTRAALYVGDALETMRDMEAASVDAIVTDPPYALTANKKGGSGAASENLAHPGGRSRITTGFMGKAWDGQHITVETWAAALRVAKPGAHLVAFGGTRTHHRLMCAIEDAGWEIRDCLMWVYGSGFPKSLDVGKAIDKHGGAQVAWFGPWLREERQRRGIKQKELALHFPSRTGGLTGCVANWELGFNLPTPEQFNTLCDVLGLDFDRIEEAEREVVGNNSRKAGWFTAQDGHDITAPATDAAKQWDGWGTSLKPAWEPIILARKPLMGTVAANVQEYGTGGINVDGCRVGNEGETWPGNKENSHGSYSGKILGKLAEQYAKPSHPAGRWPANVVHDGSEEVVEMFPQQSGGGTPPRRFADKTRNTFGKFQGNKCPSGIGPSSGSAARFFYCAKASRSERDAGLSGEKRPLTWSSGKKNPGSFQSDGTEKAAHNNHPTVKPIALMRWLCRLVTPPDGLILDPFCGSGSTGVAASLEGFRFIGIDDKPDYCEIARRRIAAASEQDHHGD